MAQLRAEHYAPLLALVDAETNELFQIGEAVVLLTDPRRLSEAVANWAAAGFEVPDFGTAIVDRDDQFDALVASCLLQGRTVIIDPKFDLKQQSVSGAIIHPLDALLAAGSAADEQIADETGAPDQVDGR